MKYSGIGLLITRLITDGIGLRSVYIIINNQTEPNSVGTALPLSLVVLFSVGKSSSILRMYLLLIWELLTPVSDNVSSYTLTKQTSLMRTRLVE